MKRLLVICLTVTMQVGLASELTDWEQFFSKAKALVRADDPGAAIEAFKKSYALAIPGSNINEGQFVALSNALANAYLDTGQYAQAEHQWRNAASVIEKSEGANSIHYALLWGSVVALPTYNGNRQQAILFLRRAIAKDLPTATLRDLAVLRTTLAQLLIGQKLYREAEQLLEDSQVALTPVANTELKQLAIVLNARGYIRDQQSRFVESTALHRQEVQLFESAFGKEHSYLVTPLNNLATSLTNLGHLEEARPVYERAAGICSRTSSGNQLNCAWLMENYAIALRALGRRAEAKKMLTRGRQLEEEMNRRNGIGLTVQALPFTQLEHE